MRHLPVVGATHFGENVHRNQATVYNYSIKVKTRVLRPPPGEQGPRRRDDAESKIAHETTDALTLSGHARTPSGCKSGGH
jgi:hypothetical protein